MTDRQYRHRFWKKKHFLILVKKWCKIYQKFKLPRDIYFLWIEERIWKHISSFFHAFIEFYIFVMKANLNFNDRIRFFTGLLPNIRASIQLQKEFIVGALETSTCFNLICLFWRIVIEDLWTSDLRLCFAEKLWAGVHQSCQKKKVFWNLQWKKLL